MSLIKSRLCYFSSWNLFSYSLSSFLGPASSHNTIPGTTSVFAPASTLVFASAPILVVINKLFKQFMKTYLKSNQRPKQPPTERGETLNTKVPKVYYVKLYIDCYHFYQRCKDYFETARATKANRNLFAAFFFRGNISLRWTQFKCHHQDEELNPITWAVFNVFLQKNLGKSKSFVDNIWKKLTKEIQY